MIEKNKDNVFKDYDYLFEKEKDFIKLRPFLLPKLSGRWRIIILEPKVEFIRDIILNEGDKDVDIDIYVKKDLLGKLITEYPKLTYHSKSKWEKYMEYIYNLEYIVDKRACSEIYNRCDGNMEIISEAVSDIIESLEVGSNIITLKDVNKRLVNKRTLYANKVVAAFLTRDKKRWDLLNTLIHDLGMEYAFYSIRKYVKKLLEEKQKYLTGGNYKDKLVEKVDVWTIGFLYIEFMQRKPMALIVIFNRLERRYNNASTF